MPPRGLWQTHACDLGATISSAQHESKDPILYDSLQVTDAERRLRAALLYDELYPTDGYKLARYNDPFTPPFLRRNEVLIRLEEFELEPVA